MLAALAHRGPDDEGLWADGKAGVVLGHRRLSILDLSELGHQPMHSRSGRWVVAYNGEVYNHVALRRDLEELGHPFEGGSDTEVLLAAVEQWGVPAALERCIGMFAIALWDRRDRELHLVRDRVGKKPLYYGWSAGRLVFASELKAFRALDGFAPKLDRAALSTYFRYNAITGTRSVYEGISKVEPGGIRTLRADAPPGTEPRLERYWSALDVARRGLSQPLTGEPEAMVDALDALLRDAVRLRLESDVPLGAFLSGGIDSSAVVALMQAELPSPAKTFSIGFHVPGWDEAPHARAVASHLGTDHTELYLTAEDARSVIPELPTLFDEPFCDVSQIPTYLVSRLARTAVTVVLSGDGGDELFTGYPRYPFVEALHRRIGPVPKPLRRSIAHAASLAERAGLVRLADRLGLRAWAGQDRVRLARELLAADDPAQFYRYAISMWREDRPLVLGSPFHPVPPIHGIPLPIPEIEPLGALGSYLDTIGYLVDDILVKVDRASMAVSLEARAPLLDHRVVELAWRMPHAVKTRGGELKWPLKTLARRYVPRAILDRPKMGFGVPIGEWLRGPLKGFADDLVSTNRLKRAGILDAELVARRWSEHRSGRTNWAPELWAVLMFEAWRERWDIRG